MIESQYERCLETERLIGRETLGLMSSDAWYHDPKHLLFTLARYKFVSKMLADQPYVAEIGCGDAFGTRLVKATVRTLVAYDADPVFIDDIHWRNRAPWIIDAMVHDILVASLPGLYSAIYALDVLEHISKWDEEQFFLNILKSLSPSGALIIGMPSLESQQYASPISKAGHVNCKSGEELRATMKNYFKNVLMFSMSDEIVHTGFFPMANYLFAVGSGIA